MSTSTRQASRQPPRWRRHITGTPDAVHRYLHFLHSGSSDYSIELLKKAGVDMTSPEPVRQALQTL